jgi:hypothetical protein
MSLRHALRGFDAPAVCQVGRAEGVGRAGAVFNSRIGSTAARLPQERE